MIGVRRPYVCLSVCLSDVAYISSNSKTKRPRKTKFCTGVPQVTCDSHTDHRLQGQQVKSQGNGAGAYCGGHLSRTACFRDKARYWSKTVIFSYPLYSTPSLGGSPSEYCYAVWREKKTRMAWLPEGGKILMICLFVLTQLTNVTDRHTDRHRMTAKVAVAAQKPRLRAEWVVVRESSRVF